MRKKSSTPTNELSPPCLAGAANGAMGGAMAECLLRKGFRVIVRDIVPERADALARLGARPAASTAEAASVHR